MISAAVSHSAQALEYTQLTCRTIMFGVQGKSGAMTYWCCGADADFAKLRAQPLMVVAHGVCQIAREH
jgi:hypothetical protein